MSRDQLRFLASGILFGFIVGYLVAYAVHEPRFERSASAGGNFAMGSVTGSAPSQSGTSAPQGGSMPPQSAGLQGEEMMDLLRKEIAALKDRLEKDPTNLPALVRLANLNHDSGQFAQAVELYARALAVHPEDVNVRTDMAICLRELGRVDEALEEFHKSLATDSGHWKTWLNLGIVSLLDRQDVKTAAEAFDQVEKLNPGYKDLPRLKESLRRAKEGSPGS